MEAKELRELKPAELATRVTQWKEELFRGKLKRFSGEVKDKMAIRKLRRTIARANTILGEAKDGGK